MTNINQLDSYYTSLYTAIIQRNKVEIINLITAINSLFPDVQYEAEKVTANRLRQECSALGVNPLSVERVPWSFLPIFQRIVRSVSIRQKNYG